jgi:DNA-binding beta-propeller fold protein YncE
MGVNGFWGSSRWRAAVALLLVGVLGPLAWSEEDANPYSVRIKAPPVDDGEWVNTAAPIVLADLRGRFVLLDFWTYCCINCMHVLPELKKLERAFPNELVVIGVHSAKFEGEQVTDNIREAALRHEIEHPVVNDAKMTIWQRYGARSWPTLVLIDPVGDVVWVASGERDFEDIKAVIDRGLPYYRAQGLLKPAPRPEVIGPGQEPETPLRFPGKVLADEAGKRLYIADSNHNRIVVAKFDGAIENVIGSGQIGRIDGSFEACRFNHPQGMVLVGDSLYVADTENHLLRNVDLTAGQVTTAAGTGERGRAMFAGGGKRLPGETDLASPWALWRLGNDLFIAMAGPHQLWRMSLDMHTIEAFAGNGREDIVDGPLLPRVPYELGYASFAQPSGLASDGNRLFVADSEGSTIRSVPFHSGGQTQTLVGLTGTLFDFGDEDGRGRDVRLQHPLGVACWDGKLYVADTYNNKIKVINVADQSCTTVAGSRAAGKDDAAEGVRASFNEPGGISAAGGKLYVADTNNHAIRVVELSAPYRVTTFEMPALAAPKRDE